MSDMARIVKRDGPSGHTANCGAWIETEEGHRATCMWYPASHRMQEEMGDPVRHADAQWSHLPRGSERAPTAAWNDQTTEVPLPAASGG